MGDRCTEGSRTAKTGTGEQKRYKRLYRLDKRAQQRNVQSIPKLYFVDDAGIGGRKKRLPAEVLTTTSWLSQEVSRSHNTCGNEMQSSNCIGLTIKEGQNVNLFEIRIGISYANSLLIK